MDGEGGAGLRLNSYEPSKVNIMESLLYIIAVILIIGWLIGFVGYQAGGLIHILLVIAVIAVLLRLIRGRAG
jgi:predicted ferric reductase